MKFDIRNQSDNSADIFFYGDILSNDSEAFWGYDEVVPSDVVKQLAELKGKDLNIHISSYGGSVFGGMAIYSSLMAIDNKKTVFIDSIGASIASVIAMAGDKIVMPNNSMLMIHPAFCSCCANAEGMRKQAELLEKIDGQILDIYKTRLRDDYDVEDLKALIEAESWLTAKECAEIFNNIELVDEQVEVFAKADKSDFFKNYKNIPKSLLDELQKEDEEVCEKCGKNPCECEEQQTDEKVEDKVEEEKVEETQEEIITEEEQQEEEIVDEEEKKDNKIGELKIEEEDEDDDVIKIKFVNQQEEEIVEDSCKKDDKKDKCEKDDKKCLVMKCPECDYEGEFDMDEEGNYVCPECGFKLEPDKEEEPDIDEDEDMEDSCKTDDEKDKCKKEKEKAQAQAKKELEFLKAKMFLDNFK